jgi:hypothetical protein
MGDRWSKSQRRELRELQGLVWQREPEGALRELHSDFETWNKGDISGFELSDRIHKFHNGRSRELYNMYSGSLDHFLIELVVARDIIDEAELSDDLLDVLKDQIARWRERLQEDELSHNSE